MPTKPQRKSPFKPVEGAARATLEQILQLGLVSKDRAHEIVSRIFTGPLNDAMEISQQPGAHVESEKKKKRNRRRGGTEHE